MFKYVIESSCSSCLVEVHIRGHEHLANIDSSVDLQHHINDFAPNLYHVNL